MQRRHIADGLNLSRIAVGCMRLTDDPDRATTAAVRALIDTALAAGATTFDHADIYGSASGAGRMHACEALFGQALRERPGLRDGIELVSKCGIVLARGEQAAPVGHYDFTPSYLRRQVEGSLRALGTDRLDLLLLHRPDLLMEPLAVAETLAALVEEGKTRAVGVSNFTTHQMALLERALGQLPIAAHQVELSPVHMDALHDGTLDQMQARGTVPMAWSPLGGRRLFDTADAVAVRVRAALSQAAEAAGLAGIGEAAIAWLMTHPSEPVAVLGTTQPDRLRRLAGVATPLDRVSWYRVVEAWRGSPVP
ncbi:MAG: aldo/keto reductase [Azospirillaceae bacterium]